MPVDNGNQTVSIKYYDPVDSSVVNQRFFDVKEVGIYSGGEIYKTGNNCVIPPLVFEIKDRGGEDYQIRVSTSINVSVAVIEATPYVVVRWTYTGNSALDYAEFLAVAVPEVTDVIIGLGIYNQAGALLYFVAGDFDYAKTVPDYMAQYMKVLPRTTPSSSVIITRGQVHTGSSGRSNLGQLLSLNSYSTSEIVYLYIDDSDGVVKSSASVSVFGGKALLAKITIPEGGIITASDITDVRAFLTPPAIPDGTTIQRNSSSGKLEALSQISGQNLLKFKADYGIPYAYVGSQKDIKTKSISVTSGKRYVIITSFSNDPGEWMSEGSTGLWYNMDGGAQTLLDCITNANANNHNHHSKAGSLIGTVVAPSSGTMIFTLANNHDGASKGFLSFNMIIFETS